MKDAVLFLSGRYQRKHLDFYRKLCRGKFKVAVDGGHRFFVMAGIAPDLLIGDFDSLRVLPRRVSRHTEVMTFPVDKDKTDCHLALDYCRERRVRKIDIVQPTFGDPDHFTANLLLLAMAGADKRRPAVRILNHSGEMRLIRDETVTLRQANGEVVSVIPLSPVIRYSCTGTEFDVTDIRVRRGETVASRNRVISSRATFRVSGEAWLFRNYRRCSPK